jgi:hypothetical protein
MQTCQITEQSEHTEAEGSDYVRQRMADGWKLWQIEAQLDEREHNEHAKGRP